MTHIHVAAVAGGRSGALVRGLFTRGPGEALAGAALMRLGGFGTRVILADDFRNPACVVTVRVSRYGSHSSRAQTGSRELT
jgi:hypothetical protein